METCSICLGSFQAGIVKPCLVGYKTNGSDKKTPCQLTFCLNCLVTMAQKGQRCGCGGRWSMTCLEPLGLTSLASSPKFVPSSSFAPFRRATLRRRCLWFSWKKIQSSGFYWLRTITAFVMGALLQAPLSQLLQSFLGSSLVYNTVHLFCTAGLVWPLVHLFHVTFREDPNLLLFALSLVIIISLV